MSLTAKQIHDLVLMTQEAFVKRGAFTKLTTDLTDFTGVRVLWPARKTTFTGGTDWRVDLMLDHNHSARSVALYEPDVYADNDKFTKGTVQPRHLTANYIYDAREPDFQRGPAGIVDIVKGKLTGMMDSFHEIQEGLIWTKPEDYTNVKDPYGIPYWIVKGDKEGFTGGNPIGFPQGCAGVDSTKNPRWSNWSATYSEVSKQDLVRKMRKAQTMTNFISVISNKEPVVGSGRGVYTNYNVIHLLEEILEEQNMNLGNDVASKDGFVHFRGTPVTYVPMLENDSSDPVYMIDWKYLSIGVMAGWEHNLQAPVQVGAAHTVRAAHLDVTWNTVCSNRRAMSVLYKAA